MQCKVTKLLAVLFLHDYLFVWFSQDTFLQTMTSTIMLLQLHSKDMHFLIELIQVFNQFESLNAFECRPTHLHYFDAYKV